MDFLTLFAIYVVVVLTCIVLVCKNPGQQQNPFTLILDGLTKVRKKKWCVCVIQQKVTVWRYFLLFPHNINLTRYSDQLHQNGSNGFLRGSCTSCFIKGQLSTTF